MGEKIWIQDFATGLDRLRIHFITEDGQVISIVVIQYEAYIDGKWRAIIRFDEAHGFFHQDVMSPTGGQVKTAQPAVNKELALNDAIAHIKQFWRTYRETYEENIMRENNDTNLTGKNLDRLSDFLNQELENPTFTLQIPDGAHIFHGSYSDTDLTQDNLKLATRILLGMMLGYVEDAPLMMVFEHKHGKQTLLDLSETLQKEQAQAFIGRFQKQSQKKMTAKINQLLTV